MVRGRGRREAIGTASKPQGTTATRKSRGQSPKEAQEYQARRARGGEGDAAADALALASDGKRKQKGRPVPQWRCQYAGSGHGRWVFRRLFIPAYRHHGRPKRYRLFNHFGQRQACMTVFFG